MNMKKWIDKILLRFGYMHISEHDHQMKEFCKHIRLIDSVEGMTEIYTDQIMLSTFRFLYNRHNQ